MFKAIKEFFFGKPYEPAKEVAPYKIEPATVPVPPPTIEVKVEAAPVEPLNPVAHVWPKAEPASAPAETPQAKKARTTKPKDPNAPKKVSKKKSTPKTN